MQTEEVEKPKETNWMDDLETLGKIYLDRQLFRSYGQQFNNRHYNVTVDYRFLNAILTNNYLESSHFSFYMTMFRDVYKNNVKLIAASVHFFADFLPQLGGQLNFDSTLPTQVIQLKPFNWKKPTPPVQIQNQIEPPIYEQINLLNEPIQGNTTAEEIITPSQDQWKMPTPPVQIQNQIEPPIYQQINLLNEPIQGNTIAEEIITPSQDQQNQNQEISNNSAVQEIQVEQQTKLDQQQEQLQNDIQETKEQIANQGMEVEGDKQKSNIISDHAAQAILQNQINNESTTLVQNLEKNESLTDSQNQPSIINHKNQDSQLKQIPILETSNQTISETTKLNDFEKTEITRPHNQESQIIIAGQSQISQVPDPTISQINCSVDSDRTQSKVVQNPLPQQIEKQDQSAQKNQSQIIFAQTTESKIHEPKIQNEQNQEVLQSLEQNITQLQKPEDIENEKSKTQDLLQNLIQSPEVIDQQVQQGMDNLQVNNDNQAKDSGSEQVQSQNQSIVNYDSVYHQNLLPEEAQAQPLPFQEQPKVKFYMYNESNEKQAQKQEQSVQSQSQLIENSLQVDAQLHNDVKPDQSIITIPQNQQKPEYIQPEPTQPVVQEPPKKIWVFKIEGMKIDKHDEKKSGSFQLGQLQQLLNSVVIQNNLNSVDDLKQQDYLFFPINQNQSHWVSVVINLKNWEIGYFDSYYSQVDSNIKQGIHHILEYLGYQSYSFRWAEYYMRQDNGYDCGIFSLLSLLYTYQEKKYDYNQRTATEYRRRILYDLAIVGSQGGLSRELFEKIIKY